MNPQDMFEQMALQRKAQQIQRDIALKEYKEDTEFHDYIKALKKKGIERLQNTYTTKNGLVIQL